MINYYCPGFVESQRAYRILFWLRDHAPQCFYDNVRIKKIYGNFPNMIWNGGSYWFGPVMSREDVRQYFNFYSDKDVTLQLVCTNPILEETDVYDRYCNMILDEASHWDFVEVLVSSDILEKYIREKYPHMHIDKSIIATTRDRDSDDDSLEGYLKTLDDYNMCVLPRKYSKNFEFLEKIPVDKRDRFEILVTDPCPITCPRLYTHYTDMARVQLYEDIDKDSIGCTSFHPENPFHRWTYRKYQSSYEELCEKYEPLGFTEIKISGRTSMVQMVIMMVPYLIKPEYRSDIYYDLFSYLETGVVPPDFS